MSWALLAANQTVSWADLYDAINTGILPSGGTALPSNTSGQNTYKSIGGATAFTAYVNVNTANTGYVARATNQSFWKSDLTSNVTLTSTFSMAANTTSCIFIESDIKIAENLTIKAKYLKEGDFVYSKSNINDEYELYKITKVVTDKKQTVEILTSNCSLIASYTQPIFRNNVWVDVSELKEGDSIYTEGGYEKILSITNKGELEVLFYTIENAHTYFANGIFCHNKTTYPITGWSSAALACSGTHTPAMTWYYTGTFGNGTVIYQNSNGGGFPSTSLWGTGTSNFYYNITTNASFTVTYNSTTQLYTVANYALCTPLMTITVKNNNTTAKAGVVGVINGNNFFTGVTISGSGGTASGTTTSEVVGANAITLSGGASTKTISSIIDTVTLSAVSFSITGGNGTTSLVLSVTLTAANETNGITITIT